MTPMQSAGALLGWIVVLTWLAVRAAGRLHLPVRGPRMLAPFSKTA